MAPKKRSVTLRAPDPPNVLLPETLADLGYIEPARARDRVISCINELFARVDRLERLPEHEHEQ
jgi:hypothetical protein